MHRPLAQRMGARLYGPPVLFLDMNLSKEAPIFFCIPNRSFSLSVIPHLTQTPPLRFPVPDML